MIRPLLVLALLAATPALAREAPCPGEPIVLRSDGGRSFTVQDLATLEWPECSSGGRVLTYGAEIWRGRIDGKPAYLTFSLIPGASGPSAHMDHRPGRHPVRPRYEAGPDRGRMIDFFVVHRGPLKGEWRLQPCGTASP